MDEDTTVKNWDGTPPAVFLADMDAKTARRLTAKGVLAWYPVWLDEAHFLCMVERKGDTGPSLVRMPLAGGAPTLLVGNARQPSISAAP